GGSRPLNLVSGEVFDPPDDGTRPPQRSFSGSWFVKLPTTKPDGSTVVITGTVRFWRRTTTATLEVVVQRTNGTQLVAVATFTFSDGSSRTFSCPYRSSAYRELMLK